MPTVVSNAYVNDWRKLPIWVLLRLNAEFKNWKSTFIEFNYLGFDGYEILCTDEIYYVAR